MVITMTDYEFAPHYDPSPFHVLQGVVLAYGLGYLLPALTAAEPLAPYKMGILVVAWSLVMPIRLLREVGGDGPGPLTADDLEGNER